jgi:hypothetical protein
MKLRIAILALIFSLSPNLLADRTAGGTRGSGSGGESSGGSSEGKMKTVNDMKGAQPIVEPFKEHFDKCALKGTNGSESKASVQGQCKFEDMGIDRDIHVGRPSCHHKGEAIDVGKIDCGGRLIDPKTQKETYMEIAKCMATEADDKFKVIYMDETPVENMMPGGERGKHQDHMHIQLKTCSTGGRSRARR